jgi:hypothetical protein
MDTHVVLSMSRDTKSRAKGISLEHWILALTCSAMEIQIFVFKSQLSNVIEKNSKKLRA